MKKLLLGLGTATAVVAPIAAVVACGTTPLPGVYAIQSSNDEAALRTYATGAVTGTLAVVLSSIGGSLPASNTQIKAASGIKFTSTSNPNKFTLSFTSDGKR